VTLLLLSHLVWAGIDRPVRQFVKTRYTAVESLPSAPSDEFLTPSRRIVFFELLAVCTIVVMVFLLHNTQ
jgi:hypothetical protein